MSAWEDVNAGNCFLASSNEFKMKLVFHNHLLLQVSFLVEGLQQGWGCQHSGRILPWVGEALGSVPSTVKTKQNKTSKCL